MSLYREIAGVYPGIGVGTGNQAGVRTAQPVIGRPHAATGSAINWLMGRGHQLAVSGPKLFYAGTAATFSFWVWPDDVHRDYTWWIGLSGRDGLYRPKTFSGTITLADIGSGAQTVSFTTPPDGSVQMVQIQQVAPAASNTPLELQCTIDPNGSTAPVDAEDVEYLLVHGIHIQEAPQVFMDGKGVATSTLEARQPIFWDFGAPPDKSITTLVESSRYAHENYARRGELFTWFDPFGSWSTTSTSYVDVFPVRPAVQTRLIDLGQTRGTAKVRVCARVSGGEGAVRLTMTNGANVFWAVTNTLNQWLAERNVLVECDDPDRWPTDGGIRGGTRDEIRLEAFAPSGGTIHVVGLSMAETPTGGGAPESANVLMQSGTPVTYGSEYIFVPVPYP